MHAFILIAGKGSVSNFQSSQIVQCAFSLVPFPFDFFFFVEEAGAAPGTVRSACQKVNKEDEISEKTDS